MSGNLREKITKEKSVDLSQSKFKKEPQELVETKSLIDRRFRYFYSINGIKVSQALAKNFKYFLSIREYSKVFFLNRFFFKYFFKKHLKNTKIFYRIYWLNNHTKFILRKFYRSHTSFTGIAITLAILLFLFFLIAIRFL